MNANRRPLVLMILDGWGYNPASDFNAIALGRTPCWDALWRDHPWTLLETSGTAVGLPDGQMGNSEVGHMNIGAGRIVHQDFTRIEQSIADGSFYSNPVLCEAMDPGRSGRCVHIMGLLSPGGVHSHEEQIFATVRLAADRGATRIRVHAFLDGRDTPPRSAGPSLERLQTLLDDIPGAAVATVCGRYFAMDRDQRWDRVQKAYAAIADARGMHRAPSAAAALERAYERGQNDEFVEPTVIAPDNHADEDVYTGVSDGDTIIFANFRADRARELTQAFTLGDFTGFPRRPLRLGAFVTMTEYQDGLPVEVAYPPLELHGILGEILAAAGLSQLRIAETEKYAHVTFFLNGGREQPYPGEERVLIPSPQVATYDLKPEMSAPELTERLVEAIDSGRFDVIICNVANPDMVGHTGNLNAAIEAVEAVDECLRAVSRAVRSQGGELLVTADHGNIEQMKDAETGQSLTAHTTHPVPLVFVGRPAKLISGGSLRDIAPTMLYLLGLPIPGEMTGRPLVDDAEDLQAAG